MALRSGYYGVKKSVLRAIEGLSGAKIIKTIGNGLKLTNAGTLSVDIDTDTMDFKAGKLASKGLSVDYSENEFDTGKTWINGKKIWCKVITSSDTIANGTILLENVDKVVNSYGSQLYTSGIQRFFNFPYNTVRWELYPSNNNVVALVSDANFNNCEWVFEYTKIE